MRHIIKGDAPESLVQFRADGGAFRHIRSEVKSEIRLRCRAEQYGLCAYCSAELPSEESLQRVAHLVPISVDSTRQLEYANMVLSCWSGVHDPKDRDSKVEETCDMNQKSRELPVKPTDPDCHVRFHYATNGAVFAATDDKEAHDTIDILNLRAERLRRSRETAIEAATQLRASHADDDWATFLDQDGARLEFWPAIKFCVT